MKKIILFLLLINFSLVYSQNNPIDESNVIPKNIEYKRVVKKITISSFYLSNSKQNNDTVKEISIVNFSKNGLIQKISTFYTPYGNLWKTTLFDKLGRIISISSKEGDRIIPHVKQYFRNNTKYPDSTIINYSNMPEKYTNIFSKNKVIRQNHFIDDSLVDYRTYKYNDKNQLIEDFYHNSDNLKGETMMSNVNNNSFQLSFYPVQETLYEYKVFNDTIIVIKTLPKSSRKVINKKVKKSKYTLEIIEEYENNLLDEFTSKYVSEGLISTVHKRYTKDKRINNYYNTVTTDTSYVAKYTTYENQPESTYKSDIEVVYDKYKNWIKKTYSNNKIIDTIVVRNIEYY